MPDVQPTPAATPSGSPAPTSPVPPAAEAPGNPAPAGAGAPPAAAAPKPAEPNPAKAARELSNAHAARAAAEARAKAAEERAAKVEAEAKATSAKLDRFKTDPLGAIEALGMTYEEITKAAIQRHGKDTPAARIEAIEAKIKADDAARAKQQEEAARKQQENTVREKVTAYVDSIHAGAVADKTTYELLSALEPDHAKSLIYEAADGISRQVNRLPTAKEVLDIVEQHLFDQGVKLGSAAKVKAKLAPAPAAPAPGVAVEIDNPAVRAAIDAQKKRQERAAAPKTLTNKLAAAPVQAPPEPGKKLSPQEAMRQAMAVYRDLKAKESA